MKRLLHTATIHSLAFIAGLTFLAPISAQAQINYQGRLTDAAGATLPDGQYSISFTLWSAATGGTQLWGPYAADGNVGVGRGPLVDVVGGINPNGGRFNVIIGGTDTSGALLTTAMAASASPFLQIQVSPNAAISPRQQILAAPRALRADVIPNITPVGANTSITGNVGIGTTTPATRLQVAKSGSAFPATSGVTQSGGHLARFADASTAVLDIGGNAGSGYWLQVTNETNLGLAYPLTLNPNGGNVGIGTTAPSSKLTVSGNADFTGNVGIGTTAPSNKLTVSGNADFTGNVGIGTTTPTQAKLVVNGFTSFTLAGWNWAAGNNNGSNTGAQNFSVYATGFIGATTFTAYSDERIKHIEGQSNGFRDLATLSGIEVTDYTYIDTVTKSAGKQKKVIAQQVEKVYPQAVHRSTDVVPDIYQKAEFKDGWVKLATSLKVGERVRLIGENKEAIHEVLEVRDGAFRTAFQPATNEVFVYGREVKDFRSVDYEAISMLNVSATQQIKKEKDAEIKALQDENAALKAALTSQDKRVTTLEAQDKARDVRLASIEKLLESPDQPVTRTVSLKAE